LIPDSVHVVCRIPAGAGAIRHSVALAIFSYVGRQEAIMQEDSRI